jgi:UDP-N-acetylmuramoyl-L-alanyl-D-glutamate--2,6-diaminopimelate ligase
VRVIEDQLTPSKTILNLSRLLETLDAEDLIVRVLGSSVRFVVTGVTDNSRDVDPGAVFVAIRGQHFDGNQFIGDAVNRGARAVVTDSPMGLELDGVTVIEVKDARAALAMLSHEIEGRPSDNMSLIGVTGTNGKTTTTWLVHHMLTEIGRKAGLIGTIECRIGTDVVPTRLTTPEAPALNRLLGKMVAAGCSAAVMEVSSHALSQKRVTGLRFTTALFTNLTRDHLDYHGTTTAYRQAKRSLFTGLAASATAIVNRDDPSANAIVEGTAATCLSFGTTDSATHRFNVIENRSDGLRLDIDGDTRRYQLIGGFNAYNLTAAYTVGVALGYARTDILDALETARPVPGRLEQFSFSRGVTAIVDYAHTPDALKNALTAIKDTAPAGSTLWCIFGCGGDRDPGKRPEMGSIAEAYADRVIVTSDNPRNEAPDAILDDIRDGMERPEEAEWIVDRREAIRFAGRSAASGDIVLVAGKGHEPYQVIGTKRIHFDDREEVERWFA